MLKTPKSEATIQNKLNMTNISWEKVYSLGGEVTTDTFTRMFNFKLHPNIMHLNKSLYIMGKHNTCMCYFCKSEEETPIHIFAECRISRTIWRKVQLKYLNNIQLHAFFFYKNNFIRTSRLRIGKTSERNKNKSTAEISATAIILNISKYKIYKCFVISADISMFLQKGIQSRQCQISHSTMRFTYIP